MRWVIPLWKYNVKKTNDISLHDCRATQIKIDHQDLCFEFPDGFWVAANTDNNSSADTLRTDKSQLKICNYDISNIYIFKEFSLFGRLICTRRVEVDIKRLIDNVNCGRWSLEFLYEYHTYHGGMFSCWIWSKEKPYHRECQLILDYDNMECYWNRLCEGLDEHCLYNFRAENQKHL